MTNYIQNPDEPADINELNINGFGFDRETFDETLGVESADLTLKQIMYYRPLVYEKVASEISDNLYLKIHDAFEYNDEGKPVFSKKATAGVIYLIRNPLDVAVSFAHHQNKPIDRMIEFMKKEDARLVGERRSVGQLPQKLSSWSSHVKDWTKQKELKIHVVRYEDMVLDTEETFTGILRFAGIDIEKERVRKAIEFSSFEKLKKQEQEHGFSEKQPSAESFFRKGKIGSWRESLTGEQVSELKKDHRDIMLRFGYLNENGEILF